MCLSFHTKKNTTWKKECDGVYVWELFDAAERAEEPAALIYNTQDGRAITETPVEYNDPTDPTILVKLIEGHYVVLEKKNQY